MTEDEARFYLVQEDILPEAIQKTVKAKELLLRGEAATVNEAVDKVNLSRSAFYKYKDKVYPFYQWSKGKTVTIALTLEHRAGILSLVINSIASASGNILTINQDLPQLGLANVTLTMETTSLQGDVEALLNNIRKSEGVKQAKLVGYN